eukprot:6667730-Alexandrium_andersonii.AAC.1
MSASLVGSEMCIRDSLSSGVRRSVHRKGRLAGSRVGMAWGVVWLRVACRSSAWSASARCLGSPRA